MHPTSVLVFFAVLASAATNSTTSSTTTDNCATVDEAWANAAKEARDQFEIYYGKNYPIGERRSYFRNFIRATSNLEIMRRFKKICAGEQYAD
jgi:hypothetical protein